MGQTRYPPKSGVFKSRFSFKIKQHGPQQLYLQYKECWILYKIVGATSFSQHYLCIQTPLKFQPKILSSTSVNFQQILQPIPPLLLNKIIRSIPTNTPFLYIAAIFRFPIFAYNHRSNLRQNYFP